MRYEELKLQHQVYAHKRGIGEGYQFSSTFNINSMREGWDGKAMFLWEVVKHKTDRIRLF